LVHTATYNQPTLKTILALHGNLYWGETDHKPDTWKALSIVAHKKWPIVTYICSKQYTV